MTDAGDGWGNTRHAMYRKHLLLNESIYQSIGAVASCDVMQEWRMESRRHNGKPTGK